MSANTMNNCEKFSINPPPHSSVINNMSPSGCSKRYVRTKGTFYYHGVLWNVLHPENEYIPKIMKAMFDCVNQACQRSSRVLAIRYDLHLHEYSDDNKVMSDFCEQLRKRIRSHYPKSFVSLFWVREQDKSVSQHYHCVVIMDGSHIRTSHYLNTLVTDAWQTASQGSVWFPNNAYYQVDRKEIKILSKLLFRLSYFAKRKSKSQIKSDIPLYGQKHYCRLKTRRVERRSLKQCQPPAEKYSPLPGALDALFDDESQNLMALQDKSQMLVGSQNKAPSMRRLLTLYQSKQSHKKPVLSAHWLRHVDRYYSKYWPCGISVAQYARWYYLHPATARRYLCNYPPSTISPHLLIHYLQRSVS